VDDLLLRRGVGDLLVCGFHRKKFFRFNQHSSDISNASHVKAGYCELYGCVSPAQFIVNQTRKVWWARLLGV